MADQAFGRFKRVTYALCLGLGYFCAHNLAGRNFGRGVLIILAVFAVAVVMIGIVNKRRPGHERDGLRDALR